MQGKGMYDLLQRAAMSDIACVFADTAGMKTGDMPGDIVHVHPLQRKYAAGLLKKMLPQLVELVKKEKKERLVLSVYGGSGSGKSGIASLLAYFFEKSGIGSYVLSGDNYPRRMPAENDAERMRVYETEGEKGLYDYLGGEREVAYDEVNAIFAQFHAGASDIRLKHMGRTASDICYELHDFSGVRILILEWTHGNNPALSGVDYPVYLHSTPQATLARRIRRGRDGGADSPFVALVLRLEQRKLAQQRMSAKLVMQMDGTVYTAQQYENICACRKIAPMLNVYPDSIGGRLSALVEIMEDGPLHGLFSSMYLLPSVFHSDLDRGFSVIDYGLEETMAKRGDLARLAALGIDLKLDFVLNHLSAQSPQFQDILKNGSQSEYRDFFIDWNRFWEGCGELTEEGYVQPYPEYTDKMFFRKPGLPVLMVKTAGGETLPYWNTFYQKELAPDENGVVRYLGQMDLNLSSDKVWDFYGNVLSTLEDYGAKTVRLDAFAYAPKAPGRKNFLNEPETWTLLEQIHALAKPLQLALLPEIHASYEEKIYEKIAQKGYQVYDFFLPGLLLDALERGSADRLAQWGNEILAKNISTVNMLGCHDGIPLLDLKGMLDEERIGELTELLIKRGGYVKNLHGKKNMYYQVNATYFSALGEDADKMLLARAIQLFMPGRPQIWYLDLFAGTNDYDAVKRAGGDGHKEINRTNLSLEDVKERLGTDIVQKQMELIRFRNTCEAFSPQADVTIEAHGSSLTICWRSSAGQAKLSADLSAMTFTISDSE